MRNSFINALEEFSQPNTILIVGDLGFGVVENFKKKYPNQYINAGVAEQNMTGLAAGLALGGKKVFTYSIANFTILRPLEQIRNDIAYHDLNVTMVSIGGGLAYGSLGFSHHATEDLAIMRALPGVTVLAPGDTVEAFEITKRIIQDDLGPVYLRLGRAGEATLHSDESIQDLKIGKVLPLVTNGDSALAILSTGGMLETAVNVRNQLLEDEIESSIFSFHTLKPFDKDAVYEIFTGFDIIISLEEHSIVGGFSAAILEALVGKPNVHLDRYIPFALPSEFTSVVGSQDYLRDYYGISTPKIVNKVKNHLKREDFHEPISSYISAQKSKVY